MFVLNNEGLVFVENQRFFESRGKSIVRLFGNHPNHFFTRNWLWSRARAHFPATADIRKKRNLPSAIPMLIFEGLEMEICAWGRIEWNGRGGGTRPEE
jgi:hypothetical protein